MEGGGGEISRRYHSMTTTLCICNERLRHTHTHIHTQRHTNTDTQTQTDRHTDTHIHTHTYTHTDTHTTHISGGKRTEGEKELAAGFERLVKPFKVSSG